MGIKVRRPSGAFQEGCSGLHGSQKGAPQEQVEDGSDKDIYLPLYFGRPYLDHLDVHPDEALFGPVLVHWAWHVCVCSAAPGVDTHDA